MMQNTNYGLVHRLTSILLAVVMLVSMVTPGVQAVTGDTLTTTEIESDLGNDSDDSTETSQKETPEIKFATTKITLSVDKDGKAITNAINRIQTGVSGATYEYKSDDDSIVKVDKYGVLIPVGKGETKIKVTSSETNKYFSATAEYDVEVVEAENDLRWKNTKPWENTDSWSVAWNDENGFSNQVVQVIDGQENEVSDVSYSSDSTSVATVNEEGQIELIKPGTVVITATKGDASISYVLVVAKADRIIGFADSEPKTNAVTSIRNEITEITPLVEGEKPEIRYSIRKDKNSTEEIATIDEEGLVTPKKFGKVTILAEIASDAYCNYAYAECTLVIERAKLETFRFDLTEVTTNEAGYIIKKTGANFEEPSLENSENGTITYSVFEDKNKVVDSIDKETGDITFKNNTGIVTICATRAQDDKYEEAEAYYTIEVEDAKFEGEPFYTIDGEKDAKSGWYKSDVSIKANEGYSISTDKKNWGYCLAVTEDGKHTVCFYLKHEKSGIIYEKQEVEIKKDATKPTVTINSETLSWWDQIWYWGKDTKITIEGKDDLSDVKTTEYVIKKVEELNDNSRPEDFEGWKTYEGEIRVSSGKVIVYAKVTDKAGNCEYGQTNAFIVDDKAPDISYEIQTSDYKEFYKDNVEISVDVKDEGTSIGIKKVSYKVFDGDDVVKEDNLFETENGIISQWKSNDFEKNIIVDSAFNSDYIKVEITAVDNAGNDNTAEIFLKICVDEPSIDVEDIEDYSASVVPLEGIDYLSKDRRVKITINQRKSVFEASDRPKITILETIDGVSQKYTSNEEEFKQFIESDWELSMEQQKLSLKFSNDASYEFSIEYEDVLDNKCTDGSDSKFVIDKTAPNASVTIDENSTWDKLLEILTFGLWKNKAVKVEVDCKDLTTPIKKIEYYISDSVDKMDKVALDALYKDGKFSKFEDQNIEKNKGKASLTVEEEGRFVIYVRVENILGQYMYICSDGYVIDKTKADVEITLPETNIKHDDKPVYNTDVVVDINVTEKKDDLCSGIKEIKYEIYCDNKITKEEVLYTFEYDMSNYAPESADVPSYDELCHNFKEQITIEAEANNSCNVALKVIVTDNAGNVLEETKELDIDVTAPTVEMTYKDEKAINKTEGDKGYFSGDRTATIVITEREGHFNAEKATKGIKIKAVDAKGNPIVVNNEQLEVDAKGYIADLSKLFGNIEWTTSVDEEQPNATIHTLVLNFEKDANYTVDSNYVYTDLAGNASSGVDTGNSVTPYNFAVDKTVPNASVTIDENSTWDKLLVILTFGLWKNDTVDVKVESNDEISPLANIKYYKTNSTEVKNREELDQLFNSFSSAFKEYNISSDEGNALLEVKDEERFVVYIRVEDYAGNCTYICSDGVVIDKTSSEIEIILPETNITHNNKPVYNTDVVVDINVTEKKDDSCSGIKEIKYEIYCDNKITKEEVLYTFEYDMSNYAQEGADVPSYDELCHNFKEQITIEAEANNSCNVALKVIVTDNAGNVLEETKELDIDVTAPTVEMTYKDEKAINKTEGDKGYFSGDRTATIVITEREGHFNAEKATKGIKIKAVDAKDKPIAVNNEQLEVDTKGYIVDISKLFGEIEWITSVNEEAPEATMHTLVLNFEKDANYTVDGNYVYTDLAGKASSGVDTGNSVTPYNFAVDKTAPTDLTIKINNESIFGTDSVTFNKFYGNTVEIKLNANCDISGLESLQYQKVASVSDYKVNGDWVEYNAENGILVSPSEKFVIYFRAEDKAGNVAIVNSTGVVVDNKEPVGETKAPEIDIIPMKPNAYGFYNGNVVVDVKVVDPKYVGENVSTNGFYSGLSKIEYNIYATDTGAVENGVLLDIKSSSNVEGAEFDADNLIKAWKGNINIAADKFNSNNVIVEIVAIDNAGNERASKTVNGDIKIDITPSKIAVSYDNNEGDVSFAESVYFKADRTATIVVTERNFSPELFKIKITNTDGYIPVISKWETKVGTMENGDDTTYTATIVFDNDGDYRFDIESCFDKAMNQNVAPDSGESLAPWSFTIDKTLPVVNVYYDNDDVLNGNYYKDQRIATVTVTEHNFETDRVKISLDATDSGTKIALPVVSNWASNGDVHTLTISYTADARYVFDFDYTDKAGNQISDFAEQTFYVDKTEPVISIEKIVDESANNTEGNIGFVITATDTNFDVFTPVLTAVLKNGNAFETKQLEIGEITNVKNGKVFTVTNVENDGIYRITCTLVDKAGNAYSKVTLERADGNKYDEKRFGEDVLLTFSVNRNGSAFEIDENTTELVEKYYTQNVENDIVVVEINADPLKEYNATLNGKTLVKGTDYTVTEEGGNGAWKKYTYKIKKMLFNDEGEYKLVVSSKDKADNNAFSDVKDTTIEFVIDRTAPVVTVSGLATDGRYQTERQRVTLIPTDDGGALQTIIVNMVAEDGKVIKEVVNLTGEALLKELEANEGKITFEIAEGLYQNVQIICTDRATGEGTNTNVYDTTIKNVSVSSNAFMIFWANTVARYATIIGGTILIVGAVVVIVLIKRKKNNK